MCELQNMVTWPTSLKHNLPLLNPWTGKFWCLWLFFYFPPLSFKQTRHSGGLQFTVGSWQLGQEKKQPSTLKNNSSRILKCCTCFFLFFCSFFSSKSFCVLIGCCCHGRRVGGCCSFSACCLQAAAAGLWSRTSYIKRNTAKVSSKHTNLFQLDLAFVIC